MPVPPPVWVGSPARFNGRAWIRMGIDVLDSLHEIHQPVAPDHSPPEQKMPRKISAFALILCAGTAAAESDTRWGGFYGGVQAGYAQADYAVAEDDDAPVYNSFFSSVARDVDGYHGGVHAGFRAQHERFVLGLEGELGVMDVEDDFLGLNAVDTRAKASSRLSCARRAMPSGVALAQETRTSAGSRSFLTTRSSSRSG